MDGKNRLVACIPRLLHSFTRSSKDIESNGLSSFSFPSNPSTSRSSFSDDEDDKEVDEVDTEIKFSVILELLDSSSPESTPSSSSTNSSSSSSPHVFSSSSLVSTNQKQGVSF